MHYLELKAYKAYILALFERLGLINIKNTTRKTIIKLNPGRTCRDVK